MNTILGQARLPCRIHVSTVFDMLIHTKGGPNL